MFGLHNPKTTLRGWHKKDKRIFSNFVWNGRRTYEDFYEDTGRNNLKCIIELKNKNLQLGLLGRHGK